MSTPTKEDIEIVMKGFKEFYDKNIRDQEIDVKAFFDFMEPKFAKAGYREKGYPTLKNITGGAIYLS